MSQRAPVSLKTIFCKAIAISYIVPMLAGCNMMSVEEAKSKFEPISKSRPLGCKSGVNDSASIKRTLMHPAGPTGGWYGKKDLVDYNRTLARDSNMLTMRDFCISGYVKFDTPGRLQARSYDDYFGDVYCGWAPNSVEIRKTNEPVFVSLSVCTVGDGGLNQVHEVVWFPEGKKDGVLIFSTAHPMPGEALKLSSTYSPEQLGGAYQFNSRLANDLIIEYLQTGKIAEATTVIEDSVKILRDMPDAMGSEGPVSALKVHGEEWRMILGYKLGLNLGKQTFAKTAAEYEEILAAEDKNERMPERIRNHTPLYKWLNDLYAGKKSPVPSFGKRDKHMSYSNDPIDITDYLNGTTDEPRFLRVTGAGQFWVAAKAYAAGDKKSAKQHLDKFFATKLYGGMSVEIGAAANLRAILH
ncbi:MAG: hypothetical protein K2W95_29615 [Candidatus Obscuribacterales bacterium]|nr:hypothetical protein [Candidatus Obscuribacterales bacterium]